MFDVKPAGKSAIETPEINLALRQNWVSILRLLDKQKWWILGTWLGATALGLAIISRLPAVYKAEALVMVESQKIPEKLVVATVQAELQDRVASLSQQILSAGRLEELIDRFRLYTEERKHLTAEELLDEMRSDISIKVEKGWTRNQPGAVRVSYFGRTPEIAAAVANEISQFFVDENTKTRESQARGTSAFLEDQLSEAKRRLEDQELRLSRYKQAHYGELPEQKETLLGTLQRLQVEMQGTQDALNRAEQQRLILENGLAAAEANLSDLSKAGLDPAEAPLPVATAAAAPAPRKRSEILEDQLELLRQRYTDTHPDVVALKSELEQARAAEQREARRAEQAAAEAKARMANIPAAERRLPIEVQQSILRERERASTLRAQLRAVAQEVGQRRADRERVLGQIAAYQQKLEALPVREQEMAGLTRDYQITKSNYESLLEKNMSAEIASEMEQRQKAERFVIMDKARVPEKPDRPKRLLLAALAMLTGLGLGAVVGFVREMGRGVVLGDWEIPEQVPVLGRIPPIRLEAAGDDGRGAETDFAELAEKR